MTARAREVAEIGDRLFSQRLPVMSLWQEIAMHFYPERADFTAARSLGEEFAAHLMSGAPVLARRDLAAQFQGMLRPRGKPWFSLVPEDERAVDNLNVRRWAEYATGIQRRAMYDSASQFVRATKEGDNDFAAFGQAVLTVELDLATNRLLYRCWHPRDVAWAENDRGEIDCIHRNWKVTVRDMLRRWPDKAASAVREAASKDPFKEIDCRHVIMPADQYEGGNFKKTNRPMKYVSIVMDRENETILSEEQIEDHPYIIPRWQTVSGSQYAHSPATVVALADARLLQRITWTLLEAGEKATNPPMLAVKEAIRSDIALYAGGITWADAEYDERLGEVLRPLSMDARGLTFGLEMVQKQEEMIKAAFYLNQVNLPPVGAAMTATEVQARMQEYIRAALPLFEPMESEYNGGLCEKTFQKLLRANAFGPPSSWPQEVAGLDMKWQFDSPITAANKRQDAVTFQEAAQLLSLAAGIDPSLKSKVNIKTAFRDALFGIGAKATWIRSDEEAAEIENQEAQAAEAAKMLAMVGQGAGVAEQVGKAGAALNTMAATAV
jgi:hypothetical protein